VALGIRDYIQEEKKDALGSHSACLFQCPRVSKNHVRLAGASNLPEAASAAVAGAVIAAIATLRLLSR
jgi:hypothetical protein